MYSGKRKGDGVAGRVGLPADGQGGGAHQYGSQQEAEPDERAPEAPGARRGRVVERRN